MSEIGPQGPFDRFFLENHRQQIMRLIQQLIKDQIEQDWLNHRHNQNQR